MNRLLLFFLLVGLGSLTACAPLAGQPSVPQAQAATQLPTALVITTPAEPSQTSLTGKDSGTPMTRTDQQGMVVVEVTPLNLDTPGDTLEFEVAMNTHAVDLSMDLAKLATLTTDTGITVPASFWDAILGGHHVSGKLLFPSTYEGKPLLEQAGKLTLTILNVDAPSREFEWNLK